jgi:hypothetical protein
MKLKVGLFVLAASFNLFGQSFRPLSESNKIIFGTKSTKLSVNKSVSYDVTFEKENVLTNGHQFLMTVAGISTGPAPTGNAFASKIVFFERRGKSISMFENTEGKMVTNSITTRKFLAEFPIISEDEKYITIDFAKGMSSIVVKDGMYSSDGGPSTETLLLASSTFIDKVEMRGKFLFIDQFIQFQVPGTKDFGDINLKFTFSTYEKNNNFKPRRSIGLNRLGYFESHPQFDPKAGLEDQPTYTNILKYSLEKPITYYVSKNVPAEFKQAVIDGILYWNSVFGKEVIKVDELPEGVSVHEPGYNIVQWLDWDSAGFAYADIQSNPITGEILQSHVYMTSSFAKGGSLSGAEFLKKLLSMAPQETSNPQPNVGLKGFNTAPACRINLENFIGTDIVKIQQLIMEKGEEAGAKEVITRFTSDYIREVVAHEIGHTLGLRHNFAGSLGTNIPNSDYEKISTLNFLTGLIPDGLYPSSSAMDYTQIFNAGMIGSIIRNKSFPLPYDKLAIEWGYSDELQPVNSEIPLFCTDSSNGQFQDCRVWDQMTNPILFANSKWREIPGMLSFSLFQLLETALKTNKEIMPALKALKLSPEGNANLMVNRLMGLLTSAGPQNKFLNILKKYPDLSALDQSEYVEEVKKLQEETFNSLGGLSNVVLRDVMPNENLQVPIIKESSDLFFFYLGKLAIDEEKRTQISSFFKNYFSVLEKEFLLKFSKEGQKLTFNIKDDKWLEKLMTFGEKTVFTNSNKILATFGDNSVMTPQFEYLREGQDLRAEVIKFLGTDFYPQIPSYGRNRDKITNQLVAKFVGTSDSVVGQTPKPELPDAVYDWFVSEVNRFLPVMPRTLQMKYMQELTNL